MNLVLYSNLSVHLCNNLVLSNIPLVLVGDVHQEGWLLPNWINAVACRVSKV